MSMTEAMLSMLSKIADEARGPNDLNMFKADVNEEEYRQWARDNAPPDSRETCDIMHPYVRDEWFRMGVLPERVIQFTI